VRASSGDRRWIDYLTPEDLAFLKRFVLSSGTLKELAHDYGISYPTIRLRLDRLIAKVQLLDDHRDDDPFELRLRALYADGGIDDRAFTMLLETYESEARRHDRTETVG
jgi:hypothetical protein